MKTQAHNTEQRAPKLLDQVGNLMRLHHYPTPERTLGLSGHEHKYDDVRGQGFLAQARRERRA